MNGVQSEFLHLALFNVTIAEVVRSQNSQLTAAVYVQTVYMTAQNVSDNFALQKNEFELKA